MRGGFTAREGGGGGVPAWADGVAATRRGMLFMNYCGSDYMVRSEGR